MTVFGSDLLGPAPVIAHEVSEALRLRIPRMLNECREAPGQLIGHRLLAGCVERARQRQCARVVVNTVTMRSIRNGTDRVLKQPRVIAHEMEVAELNRGGKRPALRGRAVTWDRPHRWPSRGAHTLEQADIALGRSRPSHRAAAGIRPRSHG